MTGIPKSATRARRMYQDGDGVARILEATGLTRTTLYLWLDGGPQRAGGARPLPALKRRGGHRAKGEPPASSRQALVTRLWHAAERQVGEIERRLGNGLDDPASDRDARALAILVKTLRELSTFDQANGASENDDAGPRDFDEYRAELAREIESLLAARTDA